MLRLIYSLAFFCILISNVFAFSEELDIDNKQDYNLEENKLNSDFKADLKYYDFDVKQKDFTSNVKLRALNKISSKVSMLNIKRFEATKFGNLDIILHMCWLAPPDQEPESKALIDVWEKVPGEERKNIFSGWIFATNSAISAIEHPVYDINVLKCTNEG